MVASVLVDLPTVTRLLGHHNPAYVKKFVMQRADFPTPVQRDTHHIESWQWRRADINAYREQYPDPRPKHMPKRHQSIEPDDCCHLAGISDHSHHYL